MSRGFNAMLSRPPRRIRNDPSIRCRHVHGCRHCASFRLRVEQVRRGRLTIDCGIAVRNTAEQAGAARPLITAPRGPVIYRARPASLSRATGEGESRARPPSFHQIDLSESHKDALGGHCLSPALWPHPTQAGRRAPGCSIPKPVTRQQRQGQLSPDADTGRCARSRNSRTVLKADVAKRPRVFQHIQDLRYCLQNHTHVMSTVSHRTCKGRNIVQVSSVYPSPVCSSTLSLPPGARRPGRSRAGSGTAHARAKSSAQVPCQAPPYAPRRRSESMRLVCSTFVRCPREIR